MKALVVERSPARFASARVVSEWRSGLGARVGPLRLAERDEPELPGPGWARVRPRLAGICGSDLATVDGRASRYFDSIVSFPFVPGHEVVGELEDRSRVVIEPVLGCAARGISDMCPACAAGQTNLCRNLAGGHLHPGLQIGYCLDTGGGWSEGLVAHESQIHAVPAEMSDEAALMVEPTACAVHGALSGSARNNSALSNSAGTSGAGTSGAEINRAGTSGAEINRAGTSGAGATNAVVIGAGTLGLCTVAALRHLRPDVADVIAVAKHPEQRRLAADLGATAVVESAGLRRAVRRHSGGSILDNGQLSAGADLVYDCVGSAGSIKDALAVVRPGGTVVMIGMPGHVGVDLTGLWQREVTLRGAYAYGTEERAGDRRSFDIAFELVASARLGRLVSSTYRLERYRDAIAHAADAGRRGGVKIAFDLRKEKR